MCQESGQGRHRQERLSSVLLVALDSVLEQEQALVLRQMLEREWGSRPLVLTWCILAERSNRRTTCNWTCWVPVRNKRLSLRYSCSKAGSRS